MHKLQLIFLVFLFFGCKVEKIKEIDFDLGDYKFNTEIEYYLSKTQNVGKAVTDLSFVSEHRGLVNTLGTNSDSIKSVSKAILESIENEFEEKDAKVVIIKKAKEHEFLLINEAHYIPQHRKFINQILEELSKIGYQYLALEGLWTMENGEIFDKNLEKRGYPMKRSGFYIQEPEFGNLIRNAIELNYKLIGYDQGSGEEREIQGAKNILKRIAEDGNKGKTIVLCGWDHIKESETGTYWGYALAGRLKEYSGKDPFTINQTQYYERSNRVFEDSLYQITNFSEPTVLLNSQNESIDLEQDKDWYDLFVFHPRSKFVDEIPHWILKDRVIQDFILPKVEIEYLVKIFLFEETDDIEKAVPIYIRELSKYQNKIGLPIEKMKNYKLVIPSKDKSYLVK